MIAWKKTNLIFSYLKTFFQNSLLDVYDQKNHSGFLRHLVVREWTNTWEILVNLNVAPQYFKTNIDKKINFENLKNKIINDEFLQKNITTFLITENNWLADIVNGPNIKINTLFWPWYIFEKLIIDWLESTFRISPFSFFQTNTHQAQILFKVAKTMFTNIKWNILDLYCWAGAIWITFLNMWLWEKLLWVEIVADAVDDARYNANLNNLQNRAKFIADKVENINFETENIWLIIVDPPRIWLHKNIINFLNKIKKKIDFKLLYISCNPVTMSRDLKLLEESFKIKKIKSIDMFPHTHHIEMICFLE